MLDQTLATLPREAKGAIAPPPPLEGQLNDAAEAISAWPGVVATSHWHLIDQSRTDGVDFYVGCAELGHIHLDGSIHLATSPSLGARMVAEGVARPFPYARGWALSSVTTLGVDGSVALFRRNYDRLRPEDTEDQPSNVQGAQ